MVHTVQEAALFGRELAFEAIGINHLFALGGRNLAKLIDGVSQHGATGRRQGFKAARDLPGLLLLLWRQMLPSFHPVQHALLLLGWKAIETLQPLP